MPRRESLAGRVWRLSRPDKLLAVEAAATLALVCCVVRALPRRWLGRLLRSVPRMPRTRSSRAAETVLRMIERVAHVHPCRPLCLEQAVAGRWMLARHGHASSLVIGARRPRFEAHAWLEVEGRIAPSADVHRFDPIWRSS